jgi:carboxypeptidase Taq
MTRIREWLVREIHGHGSVYQPRELLMRATGAPLSARPFLAYLEEKFNTLAG